MKQYKGYYIDHVIFNSTAEIDAFIKKQAVEHHNRLSKLRKWKLQLWHKKQPPRHKPRGHFYLLHILLFCAFRKCRNRRGCLLFVLNV